MIDRDRGQAEELAAQLDGILVLHTDGTDVDTLKQEGIDTADVYVAVTDDDRANILCALLAKHHGARRVIALVNQPELLKLAHSLGVDACISPRLATASAILKHVRRGDVLSMAVVEQANAEVIELVLPGDCGNIGRSLADLDVPAGVNIGAIVRDEQVIIPGGDDRLAAGDHIIVFALPEAVPAVERFFGRQ